MGEPHPSLLSGYGTSDTTGPLGGILRWIHRQMARFRRNLGRTGPNWTTQNKPSQPHREQICDVFSS